MTCLKSPLPAPGAVPAWLTLLQPLTAQAVLKTEHAVAGTLAILGPDLFDAVIGTAREHSVSRPDGAEAEYASWMPDPGAMEVDSWAAHLRTSPR